MMDDVKVEESINLLIKNLDETQIPMTLLSQYMPLQYQSVRNEQIELTAEDLIQDRIGNYIDDYLHIDERLCCIVSISNAIACICNQFI